MIQALNNPCSTTTAKTAEIMSRYRPIAPKPENSMNPIGSDQNSSESQTISQSPYLRNVWPHLQARPTRTRKRGRTALAPPAIKRPRIQFFGFAPPPPPPPLPCHITASPAKNLSLLGFSHGLNGLPQLSLPSLLGLHGSSSSEKPAAQTPPSSLVTLPLLPCPSPPMVANQPAIITKSLINNNVVAHQPAAATKAELNGMEPCEGEKGIDLNTVAEVPEEKDLLQQLQGPISTSTHVIVITPQPVRPVGSSISVGCINEDQEGSNPGAQVPKKRVEVEEEVESEALPAVVSDLNNKVRLANSAYKEMVGQPECSWLDSMVTYDGRHACGACKRICGEVMLQFPEDKKSVVVSSSNGFSCWVTIEWGNNGKNSSVHAFCDVIRLTCESKDYLFEWRFHTRQASQSN